MFFKQKGFYISLACGIAAIGAFAALCINMNRSEQKEPVASARPAAEEEKPARSPQRTAGRTSRSGSRTRSEGSATGGTRPKNGTGRKRAADQKKARRAKENKTVLAVVLVVVALGLLARAFAMGLV